MSGTESQEKGSSSENEDPINSFMTEVLSYRNQSIDLLCKSIAWLLYDNALRHERVNPENATEHAEIRDESVIEHAKKPYDHGDIIPIIEGDGESPRKKRP